MNNIVIPESKFEPGACCRKDKNGVACGFTLVTPVGGGLTLCWLHCLQLGIVLRLPGA